jgi:hypothetical protein
MAAKWEKIEAGHYVHKSDDGYTATVFNAGWDGYYKYWKWCVVVTTPSGEVWWDSVYDTMRACRYGALRAIDHDPMFKYFGVPYPRADGTPRVRTCTADDLACYPKAMLDFVSPVGAK